MTKIVVSGISTEIGKTFISSILVEALEADYWKPVQSGGLECTDTEVVRSLISNKKTKFHPEAYRLTMPMSPHAAADQDGVEINENCLHMPETINNLVIELAGGLMVPLNHKFLNIDLLLKWKLPTILVSRNYLGSINHTLLSIEALKQRKIPVLGIIFNGEKNSASEDFILQYSGLTCLAKINQQEIIDKKIVKELSMRFKPILNTLL